ncbi:MAG: histidinol-phosphatase [Verrucomicrobia bacterium]|nr:histidinol-phosphatase [Verrucomicrobiota bacterium]
MLKPRIPTVLALLLGTLSILAHDRARTPVNIPDLPDYRTLKCDFHIHTVFSDGSVWPDIRPEEAWREGLDAIAITDHIEYQPHKADLPTQHNRSYEIARPRGEALAITVIRGSEVTRSMPPGHLNAIFLKDASRLDVPEWRDALSEAHRQEAFIFWNHPGWRGQQPDGVARWYPEHDELLAKGWLHGIEVINGREYYPEAHRWALDHGLTLISNSDIHNPLNLDYEVHAGDHRPLTLVFARDASVEAIREALFARRTAVYSGHQLIGEARFLKPIFEASIRLAQPTLQLKGKQMKYLQIHNASDIRYELELVGKVDDLTLPGQIALPPGRTILFPVRSLAAKLAERRSLNPVYRIKNLLVAPGQGLEVELPFEVRFSPEE